MLRLICSLWRTMSNPATVPPPSVGRLRPHSIRIAVVLPAPFAPRNPKISPRPTSKLMWSTAVKLPNRLVSPFVSITLSFIGTVQFHVTIFDTRFDRLDPQIAVSFRGQVSGQLLFGQRRVGRRVVRVAEREG